VSGCDLKDSRVLRDLEGLGVRVCLGHDPAHTEEATAVVVTAAVPVNHPELLRAHERGIPVLKRAQALGAWVNQGKVLAIAGTHGKTTTTAMATQILAAAGREPTGLVGGRVASWDGHLHFGSDSLFVVEADEYDRSFHTLCPDVAVVTNVEADHLDVYGDIEGVRIGFETFLQGVRSGGRVVADPGGWLDAYWMGRYYGMITPPQTDDETLTTVPKRGLSLGAKPYAGPPRPKLWHEQ